MKETAKAKISYKAVAFKDVFWTYQWAQDAAFDGYLAIVPLDAFAQHPKVRRARMANLQHVVSCVCDDLRRQIRTSHNKAARSAARKLLKQLKAIEYRRFLLPMSVRFTYGIRKRFETRSDGQSRWLDREAKVEVGYAEIDDIILHRNDPKKLISVWQSAPFGFGIPSTSDEPEAEADPGCEKVINIE